MQSTPPPPSPTTVPVKVTFVPPDTGPRLGSATHVSTAALYSKRAPALRTPSWCSALFVTVTVTDPGPCFGAMQATTVEVMYCPRDVPASPNRQLRSWLCSKCRPETVTTCPPVRLNPHDGNRPSTVAPISYMNILPSLVKSAPPLALTSNATGPRCSPAAAPGAMHVTIVDDTRTAALPLTATSPNLHCTSPAVYPDPITLTIVPPVGKPFEGTMRVTSGTS